MNSLIILRPSANNRFRFVSATDYHLNASAHEIGASSPSRVFADTRNDATPISTTETSTPLAEEICCLRRKAHIAYQQIVCCLPFWACSCVVIC